MAFGLPTLDSPTIDTSSLYNVPVGSQLNVPNNFSGPVSNFLPNPQPLQPTSGFSSGLYVNQRYNEWEHRIEMYLDNSGNFDGTRRYPINPSAVVNLTINDTLIDWVVDGSMLLMYLAEEAPPIRTKTAGNPTPTQINGARENADLLKQYEFRGDGYDLLRIMIQPVETNSNSKAQIGKSITPIQIDRNDPKWILSYLFSIYDIEDLSEVPGVVGPASSYLRCLRLKFHDVRYQILRTTNLEYSTATTKQFAQERSFGSPEPLANGLVTFGGQSIPRALKTGLAILDIWNKTLSNPDSDTKTGTLEFYQQLDPENWDQGQSEIFYTSPASSSAAEDIEYIFAHHIGPPLKELETNVNDICFMHTKRPNSPTEIEPVCISPLTNFFSKALNKEGGDSSGELQLEHFSVTDHTDEFIDPAALEQKTPKSGNSSLATFKYGQIIAYSLMDMSPVINSTTFTTTPVYSVDIGKRQFNVEFQNNNLLVARKAIAENYIKHVYKKGTNNEKLFLPTLHKTKKDANIFPTFSLNGDNKVVRQKNGLHRLLYTGLFQNTCICFKTFGLTLRESGTFISIDKAAGSRDTDFANKIFGQWFVVKVNHVFEAGSYMNVIYAVKLHRHKERKAIFNETL